MGGADGYVSLLHQPEDILCKGCKSEHRLVNGTVFDSFAVNPTRCACRTAAIRMVFSTNPLPLHYKRAHYKGFSNTFWQKILAPAVNRGKEGG